MYLGESPDRKRGRHHFHREPCACRREVSGEASAAGNELKAECAELVQLSEGNTSQPFVIIRGRSPAVLTRMRGSREARRKPVSYRRAGLSL